MRVAVAVTIGLPVGVDVERGGGDASAALELAGEPHPDEARGLQALPPARRAAGFLTYWTRKEALLKATGEGLRRSLGSFAVTGPGEPARLLAWPESPASSSGRRSPTCARGRATMQRSRSSDR